MPGGASHDGRQLVPHGVFIRAAAGARKTTAHAGPMIDLQCGNGALLLGHGHPSVLAAAGAAIEAGFNFSGGSEVEILWAEAVRRLMPAAEQVRFTASGNEACVLAVAVARAVTGRGPLLVLRDHYFGWAAPALLPKAPARQILDCRTFATANIAVVEAETVEEGLEVLDRGFVCAIVFEPTGPSFGRRPLAPDEARILLAAARRNGSLCILDETITGFRIAPGGAQELYGLGPDLIILGKILAGGLPGGALAGRRDVMKVLDNRSGPRAGKVSHMGTGNGNPVVAAVGTATLEAIADGTAIAQANAAALRLRQFLNSVLQDGGVAWTAYGQHSGLHLFLNPLGRDLAAFEPDGCPAAEFRARSAPLVNALRVAAQANGLDLNAWPGGLTSAAHDNDAVDQAAAAFAGALRTLKRSGQALTGWGRA